MRVDGDDAAGLLRLAPVGEPHLRVAAAARAELHFLGAREVLRDGLGEGHDPGHADAGARKVQLQDPETDRGPRGAGDCGDFFG